MPLVKNDLLHRFIFDKIPVRGEFVQLGKSFQSIISQHSYPPALQKLLGEALCVASLLSAIIKFKGRLTVQFQGKGKLKLLLAQCDNHFHLRGLAKWEGADISHDELQEALRQGVLVIMLDSGPNQQRYQGIVAWRGNSLAESIEGYFRDSEQLATRIWLSVDEESAAGFLIQVLPADKESIGIDNAIIQPHWEHITRLTAQLVPDDLLNFDYQSLLGKLYPEEDVRIFDAVPVSFQCTCSRKRGEEAIYIMGEEEAAAELKNNKNIVVTCDFCSQEYVYDKVDVATIFESKSNPPPGTQLH